MDGEFIMVVKGVMKDNGWILNLMVSAKKHGKMEIVIKGNM